MRIKVANDPIKYPLNHLGSTQRRAIKDGLWFKEQQSIPIFSDFSDRNQRRSFSQIAGSCAFVSHHQPSSHLVPLLLSVNSARKRFRESRKGKTFCPLPSHLVSSGVAILLFSSTLASPPGHYLPSVSSFFSPPISIHCHL